MLSFLICRWVISLKTILFIGEIMAHLKIKLTFSKSSMKNKMYIYCLNRLLYSEYFNLLRVYKVSIFVKFIKGKSMLRRYNKLGNLVVIDWQRFLWLTAAFVLVTILLPLPTCGWESNKKMKLKVKIKEEISICRHFVKRTSKNF